MFMFFAVKREALYRLLSVHHSFYALFLRLRFGSITKWFSITSVIGFIADTLTAYVILNMTYFDLNHHLNE